MDTELTTNKVTGVPYARARALAIAQKEAQALWDAVVAIWEHTERHTTYVRGVGYTSRSDQQTCHDPKEHARLAAAEGKAWHDIRTGRIAMPVAWLNEMRVDVRPPRLVDGLVEPEEL